ncbi:hypothetical protein FACS1894199_11430 [Bacteroidia bacterium]|nr:hypothetical protein FACS1894199_11430 [Bacteroidia bacterium]
MRKQLYLDIKDKLKTIQDTDGNPFFKHFDLWNQQVEYLDTFAAPAVFIEFMPMQWHTLGGRMQNTQLTVRLHIVTEWHGQSADNSPAEERALEFLDIIDRITATMMRFSTPYMTLWIRSQSITNHNHEHYVDNVEEYTCTLRDTTTDHLNMPTQVYS